MAAVVDTAHPAYRAMDEADVETVFGIECRAYRHGWTKGIFSDCLRVGYHCLVQELDGSISGYAIISAAAGEAHILNLCIDPRRWRGGLGRHLLQRVLSLAVRIGSEDVFLEVRPSNLAARRLYRKAGFVEVATRKNYYPADQGREDAVVMAKSVRQVR